MQTWETFFFFFFAKSQTFHDIFCLDFLAQFDDSYDIFLNITSSAVIGRFLARLRDEVLECERCLVGGQTCSAASLLTKTRGKILRHYDCLTWHCVHHERQKLCSLILALVIHLGTLLTIYVYTYVFLTCLGVQPPSMQCAVQNNIPPGRVRAVKTWERDSILSFFHLILHGFRFSS